MPARGVIFWNMRRNVMSHDTPAVAGPPPRLLERVREAIRIRHYSRRTEQAYVGWIRRFIGFHQKRHPRELGEPHVTAFLSRLATDAVSASTQNQALSAILFLYDVVLGDRLPWMNDIVRAQRPERLPVVLSRQEVAALLSRLRGPVWLMASLMYGAGLRLLECAELRVKDLNFDRGELTTLAHETTHWTAHESRLARDLGTKRFGSEGYAIEELVAELGAAFLCADLDLTLEPREDHAAYIANWLDVLKADNRAIFTAASHAQRAADFINGLQPAASGG